MIQSILNLILISSALSHVIDPQSDEFIDYINSKQNSWKAQKYNRTIDDFKKLLGSRKMNLHLKYKPTVHSKNIQIPESFDSRTNWPECKNEIGTIVDQSSCGSCWAVSAASVMSDRRCIASNGTLKVPVSAIDIITCCAQCGPGCQGGESDEAFRYWKLVGVVTGGDYNTNKGCKPYPFPTCEVNGVKGKYVPCTSVYYDIPICETKCTNNGLDYESDLTYGKSDVQWFNTVEDMQREILLNGPVVAGMLASDDFFHYKSGVYQQVGEGGAGHAVRIIGWGVDQASNLPYWLVANSWTDDWGENGYFRIIRGVNSCGIEDEVCASIPLV